MDVNLYKKDGSVAKTVKLPEVFNTEYRPRLILRATLAVDSARMQPYGVRPTAGKNYTAIYFGKRGHRNSLIGRRIARKPRLKNRRRLIEGNVAGIPGTVGGPRAHGPKSEKTIHEKINKKERKLALNSAISALKDNEIVSKRGHRFDSKLKLPIVVESNFESVQKTQDVAKFMEKLGIYEDVQRAKDSKSIRAGVGKMRGRKYKRAKSVLFIVNSEKSPLVKATRNLEGVDVISTRNLSVKSLSPSGQGVRLAVIVEDALKGL